MSNIGPERSSDGPLKLSTASWIPAYTPGEWKDVKGTVSTGARKRRAARKVARKNRKGTR